jgi:putative sensory transduction histidine kinase
MTLRQELGFEITESLLDEHNHKLKSAKKVVFDLLEEMYEMLSKENLDKLMDLEDALGEYYQTIKREYYKAGSNIETFVQRNEEKEVAEKVARIERKNIV